MAILVSRFCYFFVLIFQNLKEGFIWLYAQLLLWIYGTCDHLSDKEEYHAPIYYTLKDLHRDLCVTAGQQNNICKLPQYDSFRKFWKKFFFYVKFPKKNYLGKCNICIELSQLKTKTSLTSEE